MPRILENWSWPILNFIKEMFGVSGGRFAAPKWTEVVESVGGNPPNLNTNLLVITGKSEPFELYLDKCINLTYWMYKNNELIQTETFDSTAQDGSCKSLLNYTEENISFLRSENMTVKVRLNKILED